MTLEITSSSVHNAKRRVTQIVLNKRLHFLKIPFHFELKKPKYTQTKLKKYQ